MTDPVTGSGAAELFTDSQQPSFVQPPSGEDVHAAAVHAVALVMQCRWPNAPEGELHRAAADLLDLTLEVGPRTAVVLVPGSHPDCYRLADAVRRTGGDYDGRPTEQDLRAARQVIDALLRGSGT
jgi:hypothetical protein